MFFGVEDLRTCKRITSRFSEVFGKSKIHISRQGRGEGVNSFFQRFLVRLRVAPSPCLPVDSINIASLD